MQKLFIYCALWLISSPLLAQTPIEGYVFETNNRGYLRQVKVTLFNLESGEQKAELYTDDTGRFLTEVPAGQYRVLFHKDVFYDKTDTLKVGREKAFLKVEMQRKPGYLFEASIAESRESPDQVVDAIQGATIEIYNRTADRSELVLKQHPEAFFNFTFEQGYHYTMMVRKPGYLAKRIEVYVNIKGCIICIDGIKSVTPGVVENLTAGNTMGTLVGNIELEKARVDKRIQIQNIYYDYDKWDIRADAAERLDQVVMLMNDNPGIKVELGSHTDSRGNDQYNLDLSQKRAAAAVAYIVSEGVDSSRITARGYGESQLTNRCRNGANCTEAEHQQNRRTELRITGISSDELEYKRWPLLEVIIAEENRAKALKLEKKKDGKNR